MPKDGGPAFPRIALEERGNEVTWTPQDGMSLRDWLAGQALGSLIVDSAARAGAAEQRGIQLIEWLAQLAYSAADAMLAEREKSWEVTPEGRHYKGKGHA